MKKDIKNYAADLKKELPDKTKNEIDRFLDEYETKFEQKQSTLPI